LRRGGGVSKTSAIMWGFFGGSKSVDSTWAQCAANAIASMEKGRSRGGQAGGPKNHHLATKASILAYKTKSFSHPISTHSHECKDPNC